MPSKKQDLQGQLQAMKNKKTAPKGRSKPKDENKDPQKRASETKKPRKAPTVRWAHADFHHLTDELLTLIEGSSTYRQAFGFRKLEGHSGSVPTGGKKPADLHAELADKLFAVSDPDSAYTKDQLEGLASVVGNRISALKKGFKDQREKLGATGAGLVEADREEEITGGSQIENIWDEIQSKFPWYKRMYALMGTSPILDRSAYSNSQSVVDLDILDTGKKSKRKLKSESGSDTDSSAAVLSGWTPTDEEDNGTISISSSPAPKTPAAKIKAEAKAEPASALRSTKRKSLHDQVHELATQDRIQRLKVAEIHERGKTERSRSKYEAKSSVELARLRHQEIEGANLRQEAERQRQHEMAMLERQIELEQLRQGHAAPRAFGPPGGPAYGAPPPSNIYDPALFK